MKLRTELFKAESRTFAISCRPPGRISDTEHDALAAHALIQAMEEFNNEGWSGDANPVQYALERADELMREWTKQDEVAN